eukprot:TRINITY_DN3653_c0_g3_i1.p1 TRINITY_DN3653_c0_g3~~TRINITY_DN3653_c0_g3_i1.p1  ORF type:complete len:140 (-),score=38.55 TRINITY_DN3653_c0_g3_i1:238-657(-)
MNLSRKTKDMIGRAVLNGVITGAGSSMLFGETGTRRIFNMNVPSYVLIGKAGAVGSVAGDLAHDWVLPHIPQPEKLKRIEAMALDFGTSGLATCIALKATTGLPNQNLPKAIAFGGTSKLATNWAWSNIFDSSKMGFIF